MQIIDYPNSIRRISCLWQPFWTAIASILCFQPHRRPLLRAGAVVLLVSMLLQQGVCISFAQTQEAPIDTAQPAVPGPTSATDARGTGRVHNHLPNDELLSLAVRNTGTAATRVTQDLAGTYARTNNETYRGLRQFWGDDIISNLFTRIGDLIGRWLSELINGWISDAARNLCAVMQRSVLNPNVAVNGLNHTPDDGGISQKIRDSANIVYLIASNILLLLFILCIWRYWADASWRGSPMIMAAVGRLVFTAAVMMAWPTIYAFWIQITNEMIIAMGFNTPQEVQDLQRAMEILVRGGLVTGAGLAATVFAPVAGAGLGVAGAPGAAAIARGVISFAGILVYTILGVVLITQLCYFVILKAIQTALLCAQYMFAPIFLVCFATPDTECHAKGYVTSFVEVSLWSFIWIGLFKLLVILINSNFNPWGKYLTVLGILQMMINVPQFLAKAQISPMSDYVSGGLISGKILQGAVKLGEMTTNGLYKLGSYIAKDAAYARGLERSDKKSTGTLAPTPGEQSFNALDKKISDREKASKHGRQKGEDPPGAGGTPALVPPGKGGGPGGAAAGQSGGKPLKPPVSQKDGAPPRKKPGAQGDAPATGASVPDPSLVAAASDGGNAAGENAASVPDAEAARLDAENAAAAQAAGTAAKTPVAGGDGSTSTGETGSNEVRPATGEGDGGRPPSSRRGSSGARKRARNALHAHAAGYEDWGAPGLKGLLGRGHAGAVSTVKLPLVYGDEPALIRDDEGHIVGIQVRRPPTPPGENASDEERQAYEQAKRHHDMESGMLFGVAGAASEMTNDPAAADAARQAAHAMGGQKPRGFLERFAAAALNMKGQNWASTPRAKRNFLAAMNEATTEGAAAYIRGEEGNEYTAFLRSKYGEFSDDDRAALIHTMTDEDYVNSAFNPSARDAWEGLARLRQPINNMTKGAIQNPFVRSMLPGKQAAAIPALVAMFEADTPEDTPYRDIVIGERCKAATPEQVAAALDMAPLDGVDLTPENAQAMGGLALQTNSTPLAARKAMLAYAPRVAAQRGVRLDPAATYTSLDDFQDAVEAAGAGDQYGQILGATASRLGAMAGGGFTMGQLQSPAVVDQLDQAVIDHGGGWQAVESAAAGGSMLVPAIIASGAQVLRRGGPAQFSAANIKASYDAETSGVAPTVENLEGLKLLSQGGVATVNRHTLAAAQGLAGYISPTEAGYADVVMETAGLLNAGVITPMQCRLVPEMRQLGVARTAENVAVMRVAGEEVLNSEHGGAAIETTAQLMATGAIRDARMLPVVHSLLQQGHMRADITPELLDVETQNLANDSSGQTPVGREMGRAQVAAVRGGVRSGQVYGAMRNAFAEVMVSESLASNDEVANVPLGELVDVVGTTQAPVFTERALTFVLACQQAGIDTAALNVPDNVHALYGAYSQNPNNPMTSLRATALALQLRPAEVRAGQMAPVQVAAEWLESGGSMSMNEAQYAAAAHILVARGDDKSVRITPQTVAAVQVLDSAAPADVPVAVVMDAVKLADGGYIKPGQATLVYEAHARGLSATPDNLKLIAQAPVEILNDDKGTDALQIASSLIYAGLRADARVVPVIHTLLDQGQPKDQMSPQLVQVALQQAASEGVVSREVVTAVVQAVQGGADSRGAPAAIRNALAGMLVRDNKMSAADASSADLNALCAAADQELGSYTQAATRFVLECKRFGIDDRAMQTPQQVSVLYEASQQSGGDPDLMQATAIAIRLHGDAVQSCRSQPVEIISEWLDNGGNGNMTLQQYCAAEAIWDARENGSHGQFITPDPSQAAVQVQGGGAQSYPGLKIAPRSVGVLMSDPRFAAGQPLTGKNRIDAASDAWSRLGFV